MTTTQEHVPATGTGSDVTPTGIDTADAIAPQLSQSRIDQAATIDTLGRYAFGWSDSDSAGASARRGVDEDVVRDISAKKSEPQWMLERRLKALKLFERQPMPTWGADLSGIHFDTI